MVKMRTVSIGLMLNFAEEDIETLRSESEFAKMSLGEFVSIVVTAVVRKYITQNHCSVGETIDWTKMKKDGLCE